jgi:hypothetical protein
MKCPICGCEFARVSTHVRSAHGLSYFDAAMRSVEGRRLAMLDVVRAGSDDVQLSPDLRHGPCWRWRGLTNRWGYARVRMAGAPTHKVHRISVILLTGDYELGDSDCVRHLCGVRRCVRPSHLLPGDALANARDKRRHARLRSRFG